MMTTQTLTESRIYRAYWDDGLLDALVGAALLLTGAGWTTAFGALAVVQAPLWIVLWNPLRRAIVEPRAGYVEFSLARQHRNTSGLRQTLALGVAVLALFIVVFLVSRGTDSSTTLQRLVPGLPAVLVAVGLGIAAGLTGAWRFLSYGATLVVAAAATVLLDWDPGALLAVGGFVVAVSGAVLLGRFIRASRDYEARG